MEFTLFTDYKALDVIYSTNSRNPVRIQRWALIRQPNRFKVQYVPGKQNIADPLSRIGQGKVVWMNDNAGELIRFAAENQQLYLCRKLRNRVIDLIHEGYQALIKTNQRKVWWAGIDKEVETKCKTCHGCQSSVTTPCRVFFELSGFTCVLSRSVLV